MRAPEFWSHKHGALAAPLARTLLTPLSWLVMVAGRWRQHRVRPASVAVPVICIGNVTLGGTGKTPLAIALAGLLRETGQAPAFLTRGYGGTARGPLLVDTKRHTAREVGDEALLLTRSAPTFVSRDRVAGAREAAAHGASIIIMDDGFQNPYLAKDFSFLVVDADAGLGNGRVFPAGPLREPLVDALARADALIITGEGKLELETSLPVLPARLVNPVSPPTGPLFAFAAIGRPNKFFDALRASGASLVQAIAFNDHHDYRASEIARLQASAQAEGAILVTTEKDFVRLPENLQNGIVAWPAEARFEDAAALMTMLASVLKPGIHHE